MLLHTAALVAVNASLVGCVTVQGSYTKLHLDKKSLANFDQLASTSTSTGAKQICKPSQQTHQSSTQS